MKAYLITIMTIAILFGMSTVGFATGLDITSADLPPDGPYVAPTEYFEWSTAARKLDNPVFSKFTNISREYVVDDELESFDATLTGVEISSALGSVTLTGSVETRTTDKKLSTTGTFVTEIVSMSLSGTSGEVLLEIRQDPDRASTGETDVQDLSGGLYHIDSFFDVFTELRVDQGSWVDADDSIRMSLEPEPATLGLLLLGGLALIGHRRST